MRALDYTLGALDDLDDIWRYTLETWGLDQAERYIEALEAACLGLAAGDLKARPYPELVAVSGFYRCQHHYIFFAESPEKTIILAILHERMDVINRLQDRFS